MSKDKIYCRSGAINITPKTFMPLSGFGSRVQNFQSIHDELEANVIILRQNDVRIIFVQLDLLFIGPQLRSLLIGKLNGVAEDREILCSASHTHFAPSTTPYLPNLGLYNPEYMEYVADKISSLIKLSLKKDEVDVTLSLGTEDAPYAVSRRLPKRISLKRKFPYISFCSNMGPNFSKKIDTQIKTLILKNNSDEIISIFWNWACHPVSFPYMHHVSADFPGFCRSNLRKKFDPKLPIIFLQGFCGDIRPPEYDKSFKFSWNFNSILRGGSFINWNYDEWFEWCKKITKKLSDSISNSSYVEDDISLEIHKKEIPLNNIISKTDGRFFTIYIVNFTEKIHLLWISAEPLGDLKNIFIKLFHPSDIVLFMGYVDDTFGYLPTNYQIKEGGYEVERFKESFSLENAIFDKKYIDNIIKNINLLIK